METKQALPEASADEPMLLGVYHGAAYYFNYEKDASTTLNAAFLKSIKTQAEAYVIYADTCVLSEINCSSSILHLKRFRVTSQGCEGKNMELKITRKKL